MGLLRQGGGGGGGGRLVAGEGGDLLAAHIGLLWETEGLHMGLDTCGHLQALTEVDAGLQ